MFLSLLIPFDLMGGLDSARYRKDLADTLRSSDKADRAEILRLSKSGYEYISAHAAHNFESFDTQQTRQLETIVGSTNTLDDLKVAIQATPLFIRNRGMHGVDHSEHLLKRIEIADFLSYPNLVPEAGGLRSKVSMMLKQQSVETVSTINPTLYREYLTNKFAEHNFSDEEVGRVVEKVSPDLLASIDTDIEGAAVELNALPQTKTRFSCSGHTDLPQPSSNDSYAYSGYLAFTTEDDGLVEQLKKLVCKTGTFGVALENREPGEFTVRFRKLVPDEWVKKNGRKTKDELFGESKQKLAPILGTEILDFPLDKYKKDDHSYFMEIERLQKIYLQTHPEVATVPYGWNSIVLVNVQEFIPKELEWREYKDYYLSPEAENDRLAFLKRLADSVAEYRRRQSVR